MLAALALVAVTILLASSGWWPFDISAPKLPKNKPSFWQLLLADRLTLGFVRLGVVMLAVFVIASIPALVVGGRWLKGLGTGGFAADEAAVVAGALDEANEELERTRKELEAVTRERDEALAAAAALQAPQETSG